MRFYVGSSFSNIEDVRFMCNELIALGHTHTYDYAPLQLMRYARLAKKRFLEFNQRTSSSSSCLEVKAHMLNSGLLSG